MYIEKSILAPKLAILKQALPGKQGEGIKGVLYKNKSLFATNMEIGIRTPLLQDQDECFIIPDKAIELIERLPDAPIEITGKSGEGKQYITVKAPGINNKFQSYDPYIYPEFEQVVNTSQSSISSEEFHKAIKSVMYAADNKNLSRIFSGINFQSESGHLNVVATDSHRLSWITIEGYNQSINLTIPKLALQKILKLPLEREIQISYNEKNAVFESGEYMFYTRLLEGKWPDYQKLFSEKNIATIAKRAELLSALERCKVCADEKDSNAITLNFEEDKLNISSNTQAVEHSELFKLEEDIPEAIKIGFNGTYLIDALKSYDTEEIYILMSTSVQPVILSHGNLKTLVLPLRLF